MDAAATAEPVVFLPTSADFDLEAFKMRFRGYNKLLSMLYLCAIGLPILDGLVVERWSDRVVEPIRDFCAGRGWSSVLLRHDRRPETHRAPRGGYVFELARLKDELTKFFDQGRIVILLEPRTPYADQHSLNAMFRENDSTILIEVAGPGFDASDLQRGDNTPHQHLVVRGDAVARGERDLDGLIVEQSVMAPAAYRQTVHHRLLKIAKALSVAPTEGAAKEALVRRGETLLLQHLDEYRPLPSVHLRTVLSHLANLPERLRRVSGNRGTFVLSMSFLAPDDRLVCWDAVWPHLKYAST